MARYGRSYIRPIIILGGAAKGTSLLAKAAIIVKGQNAPTGTVPLLASGEAQTVVKPSLTGKLALAVQSFSANVMHSSIVAKLALAVQSLSDNFARSAAPTGKATLFSRAFSAVLGRPSPSGSVGLSGRGEAISTLRGTILNTIQVLARSFGRATASIQASLSGSLNLRSSVAVFNKVITPVGAATLFARAFGAVLGRPSSSGKVGLSGHGESISVLRGSFINTVQILARSISKLSVALSNGQYNLAMTVRAFGAAQSRPSISGKVFIVSIGKAAVIGRSSLSGAAQLVARTASIGKSTTISAVGFLLRAASFAATKTKASANYALAMTSKTLARSAAVGLPPSAMALALRAYSALITASIAQTNSFQHRIQLFASSIAAVVGTWANRVVSIPGQFVSGARGNSVTGTGGATAVSGQSDNNVSGSGGSDSVRGSGP